MTDDIPPLRDARRSHLCERKLFIPIDQRSPIQSPHLRLCVSARESLLSDFAPADGGISELAPPERLMKKRTAEPKRTDISSEMAHLRELLENLDCSEIKLISASLVEAENELVKTAPRRDAVGRALERAINYSKEADGFSRVVAWMEPHLERVVAWLGSDWIHIVNLLNSKELGRKYPVAVVRYDPSWEDSYNKEVEFLTSQFRPDVIVRTEHFGSTAVPGLASKPVIDVLVEISSFETTKNEITPDLEKRGYVYFWRSDSPPGHMMFVKGYDVEGAHQLRYHLHMATADHPLWERLLFRDYLREFPEAAGQYEKLKLQLAQLHPNDREAYTDGKTEFIVAVTEEAKRHFRDKR